MDHSRASAQTFLHRSSLKEEVRAFLRASVISLLRGSGHLTLIPPSERLSEKDMQKISEISDFLDERNCPYTKSVFCAELGVDVDSLNRRKSPLISGISVAVQTVNDQHPYPLMPVDRRELERREKILNLEEQELRVREAAVQREKEKLEASRQKIEEWQASESRRFAEELEKNKISLATDLDQERDALIGERLKLTAELARIQKLFPN